MDPVATGEAGARMSPCLRRLQWAGVLLLVASTFMPQFAWRVGAQAGDSDRAEASTAIVFIDGTGPVRVPATELARGLGGLLGGQPASESLWPRRPIYVYLLLPFWILALLMAPRRRRLAGYGIWVLTFGLIVLEAAYLRSDYLPFFPRLLGSLENGLAWGVVVLMLVWRRPSERTFLAVESSVAAQALLGFIHGVTLPCTLVRDWIGQRPLGEVLGRITEAFGSGFWIGMIGLALVAIPGYVGRRRSAHATGEAMPATA